VQPFGGEGLSGTGPKAGGPRYVWRLVRESAPASVAAPAPQPRLLPGPTGETNTLTSRPRGNVACLGPDAAALADQVAAATRLGNTAVIATANPASAGIAATADASVRIVNDPLHERPAAVLFAGDARARRGLRQRLAALGGPLLPLVTPRDGRYDSTQLTNERTHTVNTTASGGNASLLSLEEAEPG
jgi:RHH-type proline utilization regulon transcriptional repressor/proline dehydrogenase/delta 1-pyrroline-5-carboxylate dehydrogenase